jgi:hypothetical protein
MVSETQLRHREAAPQRTDFDTASMQVAPEATVLDPTQRRSFTHK